MTKTYFGVFLERAQSGAFDRFSNRSIEATPFDISMLKIQYSPHDSPLVRVIKFTPG